MRIRGKKPWALIKGKIVRFKTQEDFDRWSEADLRRLAQVDKLKPDDYCTEEEVFGYIEQHATQREIYWKLTHRPKKKIRRRRLWPA